MRGLVICEFWMGLNPAAIAVREWTLRGSGLAFEEVPSHCSLLYAKWPFAMRSEATWKGVDTFAVGRQPSADLSLELVVPDMTRFELYLAGDVGDPYNWQAIVRALTPWPAYPRRNLRAEDCSQHMAGALMAGGVGLAPLGRTPTPVDVYRAVRSLAGVQGSSGAKWQAG